MIRRLVPAALVAPRRLRRRAASGDAAGERRARAGAGRRSARSRATRSSRRSTLTGRLEPRPGGAALLAAPAAGVVRAVRAQVGDRVARGAVVVELEVPELAADAAQKAAAAAQAEREAARQQQLLADGITSARQAEEAAANARQATAAAAAARDLLARTRVTSPVAGRVQEVMVQRGERVDAGRALAQVVAPDTLDLAVPVPAPELARLRTGLPVGRGAGRRHGAGARAGWRRSRPGVDTLTNAGEAVIRVPNRGGRLHPGATATARIRLGVRRDVLVAPDSALVLAGDSTRGLRRGRPTRWRTRTAWCAASGRTGERRSGATSAPGDRVVTTGAFGLEDGMHVVPARGAGGRRTAGEAHRPRPPAPGSHLPRRRAAHAGRGLGAVHAAGRHLSRGHLPAHRRDRARRHVRGGADDRRGHPPAGGGAERHPRPPPHPHAHRPRLGAS